MSAAARLIVADAMPAERALERAAKELGIRLVHCRPTREQLNAAVHDYRSLFCPAQAVPIAEHRLATLSLMRLLAQFRPRTAVPLIEGNGTPNEIVLFLAADTIETVVHDLYDRRIAWRAAEYRIRHASGKTVAHPALAVQTDDLEALLVLLPENPADPPCDRLDGRPMRLLDVEALTSLPDAS